jgi:acyl-CoA synthetase (AMP-forming)/AMP-acid ligase II
MSLSEATSELTGSGKFFEIETTTIRGTLLKTWKKAPANLGVVLEESLKYGDKEFIVYEDERITFKKHFEMVAIFANQLIAMGVKKGDRVAIAMRNLPEWSVGFWSILSIGAIVVPLNAWWPCEELTFALNDSESAVALIDVQRFHRIRPNLQKLSSLKRLILTSENREPLCDIEHTEGKVSVHFMNELLANVNMINTIPKIEIHPDDDATIFYTSATSGKPKGVIGSHRNSCSSIMSILFIEYSSKLRSKASLKTEKKNFQKVNLLCVPLFHVTGVQSSLILSLLSGTKLIMMPHFDPDNALKLIENERVTSVVGVANMVEQLINSPYYSKRDISTVRHISFGGAPVPPSLFQRILKAFPDRHTGNFYGMTEATGTIAANKGSDYIAKPNSVGVALPVEDVSIMPLNCTDTPPSLWKNIDTKTIGELWVKGPQIVRGYWNRPEETALNFTDGWLHTGDLARIDDEGFIYIVGRVTDMIIRLGENIQPAMIENALLEHPAIADCAVVGLPDEKTGEEVTAMIVFEKGQKCDANELTSFLTPRLAHFMIPKYYYFRSDPLPRNQAGKVLKGLLKEELKMKQDIFAGE